MMCDKSRVIVVMSKSSFLPEEQERRISKSYCRYDRPSSIYLCICWAEDPIRGHLVVLRRVNAVMESPH